ncbi:hypothetical protein [Pleurocapsa sp. PCC 7319]|uniref:hypothetical protein n=1 Tax=Pleurocapsa sp. PCC 7319 TaxID=118161 RepID=UPI000345733C|nr:hypothetical protein [Pleurocapsa sp. PCC 7319]
MKKSTLGILTAVIAFAPLTALAEDFQGSTQINSNSAAAVGTGNVIIQDSTQTSVQDQFDFGAYGISSPDAQNSVQINSNEAAAIGEGNFIHQEGTQTNVQSQFDVNQYLPSHY